VALANGDYWWYAKGYDSDGNQVMNGWAKITIQVP
jgi:hypothetical protein